MAVYKVIQDIESEDKLLGPLTLKGFVYAAIAGVSAFCEFLLFTAAIPTPIKVVLMSMFLGPMILFGVLASPLGGEQPTEVWLLSRIKFFLKPRQRLWDQSGVLDMVTVTVPKKQELNLTDGLSQDEVQSRLKALAMTLDTRGWAIKNVDVNLSLPETEAHNATPESDRLIGTSGVPQQMPVVDVHAADDIMDEKHNPTAQKFAGMLVAAEAERRNTILATIKGLVDEEEPEAKKDKHKRKKRGKSKKTEKEEVATKDLPAAKEALEILKKEKAAERARLRALEDERIAQELVKAREKFSSEFQGEQKKANPHHRFFGAPARTNSPPPPLPAQSAPVNSPSTPQRQVSAAGQSAADVVTDTKTVDKLELAQSGSAFSVSTLSQLANRPSIAQQTGPDEVTISLH